MATKASQQPQPETSPERVTRLAAASQWLLGGFFASMIAALVIAGSLETGLLWSAVGFLAWGTLISLIHVLSFRFQLSDLRAAERSGAVAIGSEARIQRDPLLPWFQRKGQIICLGVGALLVIGTIQAALRSRASLFADSASTIRLGSILFIGIAFALYFLARYGSHIGFQDDTPKLMGPVHLAKLGFGICLIITACLFAFLYLDRDLGLWPGRAIAALTGLLMGDAAIRAGMAAFQPRGLGQELPPLGGSLMLEAFFGHGSPWDALAHHVETSFGVKVGESWVSQFLRRTIEPVDPVGDHSRLAVDLFYCCAPARPRSARALGTLSDAAPGPGVVRHLAVAGQKKSRSFPRNRSGKSHWGSSRISGAGLVDGDPL